MIEELGGSVSEDKFTHLIAEKPNRGEKYLNALSRGTYVVTEEFIRKSYEAKRFKNEDEFEFGNPKLLKALKEKFDTTDALFTSCYKWRQRISVDDNSKFKNGAFTGKTFIVSSGDKTAQFMSIIESGGGKGIEMDLKKAIDVSVIERKKPDYCLYEAKTMMKGNLEVLNKFKVDARKLSFICDFLINNSE